MHRDSGYANSGMTAKGSAAGRAGRMVMLALALVAMMSALVPGTRRALADDSAGTVYVHVHACGSFSGIPPTDYGLLSGACQDAPYYNSFFITTEGAIIKGVGSNNNQEFTWNGIPNHIFAIMGQVDLHNATPVVYCQNGAQSAPELMQATSDYNGGYVHPTMAGGYVVCDWFAMRDDQANSGSISIDAHLCNHDFDPSNAGMNDFYVACQQSENGAVFTPTAFANNLETLTSGVNAAGNVYWPYVVADAVQIAEQPAAGYQTARVFCRSNLNGTQSTEYEAPNGAILFNVAAGERVECDWYDVAAAGAKVTIVNHLCPDGPDLVDADIYTLTATCNIDMNGVAFTLGSAGDNRQDITGGNMGSGIVWFDVVPTDTTIVEDVPAGYLTPRVLCAGETVDDAQPTTTEETVSQNGITRAIRAGEFVQCDWFNLPDHGIGQAGSIKVLPVACPSGYDLANASLKSALKKCQTPQDTTAFDLLTPNGTIEQKSGWYKAGETVFFGIPADQPMTLTAQPLAGFQTGAVFCGQDLLANGEVGGYDKMALSPANTIVPTIVPGAQEVCHWFMTADGANQNVVNDPNAAATPEATADAGQGDANADSGDQSDSNGGDAPNLDLNDQSTWTGRVEISVRVCPAGFDLSSGDLDGECWDDANGIGFGIYSANQWWPQTTGDWADQMVIWDPVPQQDVVIKEDVPAGDATPIVFCGGEQVSVNDDGSINVTIADHEVLACTFFNVQQ